jgi:hypothetical protein
MPKEKLVVGHSFQYQGRLLFFALERSCPSFSRMCVVLLLNDGFWLAWRWDCEDRRREETLWKMKR